MVIRDLTPNVVTCSVPFLRLGRFPVGGEHKPPQLPKITISC
jgi:hypothetical protein